MSFLYHPLKALGLYSSNVPLLIKSVGDDDFYIFSAVGCYFVVYRFSNLALVGTSDKLDENILCIAGYKNKLFTGCETNVYGFSRAKHVSKVYKYENEKNWRIIVVLGEEGYLCGVNECNRLVIWNIDSGEVLCQFLFPSENEEFIVKAVMQPRNYDKKILVASTKGKMHLINYAKNKLLYIFDIGHEIMSIEQTPNDDTIAIGCNGDCRVLLLNLVYDKVVMELQQDLGPITAIGFRSDIDEQLIMLTASKNGHVAMWNLDSKRNIGQSRHCHEGSIASIWCVPGKPLLLSNGADNSIKIWNYERPDGTPQLLRSRSGHWQPPSRIKFWPRGAYSNEIISAGKDSCMLVFNAHEDSKQFSMGRAYLPHHGGPREDRVTREQYILPPAVDMSACNAREYCWDTIAICHQSHRPVTTWSFNKRTRGKHYLEPAIFKQRHYRYSHSVATRCAISTCGDFLIIGYSTGHIIKFNIQSGIERGAYVTQGGDAYSRAHTLPICGLAIGQTGTSTVVVSAAGCQLNCWDMLTCQSIATLVLDAHIDNIALHPSGNMVAVPTADGLVNLIQLTRFILFQQIRASFNANPVNAIAFSYEFDLIMIADGNLVKTFDYINNRLVDCFRTRRVVTQLEMAPNDAFLVSTHQDDLGLYLWSLKLHFLDMKLSGLPLDYQPVNSLDSPKVYCGDEDGEEEAVELLELPQLPSPPSSINSHVSAHAQMSGLPSSYFSNLLNIDSIRIRNENATKGLASTAFFLPQVTETLEGLRWLDEGQDESADASQDTKQQLERMKATETNRKRAEVASSQVIGANNLCEMLVNASSDSDYDKCMQLIKTISPSAIDYEIQMLDPIYHETRYQPLQAFLMLLDNQMRRTNNIEVCQMYLACLLNHHIDCLVEDPTVGMATADVAQLPIDVDDVIIAGGAPDRQRLQALGLASSVVDTMRRKCNNLSRDLTQIIQMGLFAYNNL